MWWRLEETRRVSASDAGSTRIRPSRDLRCTASATSSRTRTWRWGELSHAVPPVGGVPLARNSAIRGWHRHHTASSHPRRPILRPGGPNQTSVVNRSGPHTNMDGTQFKCSPERSRKRKGLGSTVGWLPTITISILSGGVRSRIFGSSLPIS